jgi:hypothetical protein
MLHCIRKTIYMKYIFIGVLLLAIIFCGCASAPEKTALSNISPTKNSNLKQVSPDIPAIFDQQSQVMKAVKSCQSDLHSRINLKSSDSPGKNVSITIDITSLTDISNRQMSSVISNKISLSGDSRKTTQQIIATGDRIYFREGEVTDTAVPWQVKDLDQAAADRLWNLQDEQLTGSKYTEQISPSSFVYSGTETINGHNCFVFKQPLDNRMVSEIAPELLEQLRTTEDFSPDVLSEMLKNIELVCLIDEQSYLREIRLVVNIDQIIQGHQVSGTIEQTCLFDKFNEPVSIQIPTVN